MDILLGFVLCLVLVMIFLSGYLVGKRAKKLQAEQPTEEELDRIEDLNRQADELFNYSADKAYGGK